MSQEYASGLLPVASDTLPPRPNAAHRHPAAIGITKATLRRLVCPEGKTEAFYWDDQVAGLGLRAYASGKRVWLLQYRDSNGRTRRIGLGPVNALDPEKAREAARSHLIQKSIGNDPAAKRRA